MRVTTQHMYGDFINQMNSSLSQYLDLNMQAATQKQVNKPSDDPIGAAHILTYRADISQTTQLEENVSSASNWLKTADGALDQVAAQLIRMKEIAGQASTGTMSEDNRLQISEEANQIFQQIMALANEEVAGRFIFAGQNIDTLPYELGLGVDSVDPELADRHFEVTGDIDNSVLIRFTTTGDVPPANPGGADITYEYTSDGGETWKTGTMSAGDTKLSIGTAEIQFDSASPVTVTAYDDTKPFTEANGTSMTVRPAAIYKGYDNDVPPDVTVYGEMGSAIKPHPNGYFSEDVQVRIDTPVDLSVVPQEVTYSYSTDNGQTWITKTVDTANNPTDSTAYNTLLRLPVPGGFFDLEAQAGTAPDTEIAAGTQYSIKPQRTNIDYETSQDNYIMVNSVGKDIFGGLYTPQGTTTQVSAFDGEGKNLFESIATFIGALETNNQEACGRALENVEAAIEQLTFAQADIGGRMNRLESTATSLSYSKLDQTERLSNIEDADLAELTIQLTMQQMAYQTVLQSSSMVMQLNLTQFI